MENQSQTEKIIFFPPTKDKETSFFDNFEKINEIITLNITDFNKAYLLTKKDILLFKKIIQLIYYSLKIDDIEKIWRSNNFHKYKDNFKNNKDKVFLVKFYIMLFASSSFLEYYYKINYSKISLLIFKLLKKFYVDDIISSHELIAIVKFRIISSLFDKNILKYNGNLNKKYAILQNLIPIWSTIKFLTSFCGINADEHKNLSIEHVIIEILKFFDDTCLNNFNNIQLFYEKKKLIQLLDLGSFGDTIIQYVTRILVKVYKDNFNIKFVLCFLNDLFFNNRYFSNCNSNSNWILRCKSKILKAHIHFIKELFKEEDQLYFNSSEIQIPNGFYMNNNPHSGIVTDTILNFQNEGYGLVISFNLQINENEENNNKYTIFSFFQNDIFSKLYIHQFKLYLQYPNKTLEICPIQPNINYVFWLFHKNHSIISSKSLLEININGVEYSYNDISFIREKFRISIGATLDLNGNYPPTSTDCFAGMIGTFILCDHDFFKDFLKTDKFKKRNNLINLKGFYENIIYIYYKNFCSNQEQFEKNQNLRGTDLLRYICVMISSRSITSFKRLKNIGGMVGFDANYFISRQNYKREKIKYYTLCIPEVGNFACFPFSKKKSLPQFVGDNGLKYLNAHLFFYYTNLEKSKQFSFLSSDEINMNLEEICNLFLYCVEKITIEKLTDAQFLEMENFFFCLRALFENNRNNNFIKINIHFLLPFGQYFTFLLHNKLFFKYCHFLLEYDYYDKTDDTVLPFLINNIKINLKDNLEICLIDDFFVKILNFEPIYLDSDRKEANKDYSALIRELLSLSFEKKKSSYFLIYLQKTNSLKINGHNEGIITKYSELEQLILLYKYLKNLYVVIDNDEKIILLIQFIKEKELYQKMFSFFTETVEELDKKYGILLTTSTYESQEIRMSEMIKSLCIRFINDFLYNDEQLKIEENDNNQLLKSKSNYNLSFNGQNQSDLKTFSFSNLYSLRTSNFLQPVPSTITDKEDIIISKIPFFDSISLTPYTFRSFFLFPFRTLSYKEKIAFIKNKKYSKSSPMLDVKHYQRSRFYLRVVVLVIQKIANENRPTTIYCENYQLLEQAYDLFFDMLVKTIDNFNEISDFNIRKEIKPMINSIFNHQKICTRLYSSILDSFLLSTGEIVQDSQRMTVNQTTKEEKIQIIEKIENNILSLIDKTIYTLKGPFFFKCLLNLYVNEKMDDHFDFVMKAVIHIIEKFNQFDQYKKKVGSEDKKNEGVVTFEINNANLLVLIYQITFFNKKKLKFIKHQDFKKRIIPYLSIYPLKNYMIFLKTSFPIEDNSTVLNRNFSSYSLSNSSKVSNNKIITKKFLIEILFEIYFEIYIEALNINKRDSIGSVGSFTNKFLEIDAQMSEGLICDLLLNKEIAKILSQVDNKISANQNVSSRTSLNSTATLSKKKDKKTLCYIIDKLSIRRRKKTISSLIEKKLSFMSSFINEKYALQDSDISITLFFLIKLLVHAEKIERDHGETSLSLFLIKTSQQLCKESLELYTKNSSVNPLSVSGEYENKLYSQFKSFIETKYIIDENFSKDYFYELIDQCLKDQKKYRRCLFGVNGKIDSTNKLYNARSNEKKKLMFRSNNSLIPNQLVAMNSYTELSLSDKKGGSLPFKEQEKKKISTSVANLSKFPVGNLQSTFDLHSKSLLTIQILPPGEVQKKLFSNFGFRAKKNTNKVDRSIKKIFSFNKDFVKQTFSLFFLKFLTFDENFTTIKKLYKYLYKKEIKEINLYGDINIPTKIKNYYTKNYSKIFLTKDNSFSNSEYLKNTHKFLHTSFNFIPNKTKKLPKISYYDSNKVKFDGMDERVFNCELITLEGGIFGKIYLMDNCVFFSSDGDKEKDLRISDSDLDMCLSSLETDYLYKKKEIIFFFNEIEEILNRRFLFSWVGVEFFLKNGKNFFFNFFTKEQNKKLFSFFSSKKFPNKANLKIIENCKEFFKKNEFSKKWIKKDISTYEYILLLNKYSARTYNDVNQYLIFPWLKTQNNEIRLFDFPISLQTEKRQQEYLKNSFDIADDKKRHHGNHYSTSAYVCYYLMRIMPFTHNMVKFQSGRFDEPDRQFLKIENTLYICENFKDNREMIPELFSTPECFINLNYNDFGKQASPDYERVHNANFIPFGKTPIDFSYRMKQLLNFDEAINDNIYKWFDYVFGIYQDTEEGKEKFGFRNFQNYCYAQYNNFEQQKIDLEKEKLPKKEIYKKIKNEVNLVINLGQTPFQLVDESYSNIKKKYNNQKLKEQIICVNPDKSIVIPLQDKNDKVLYFTKSIEGKYIYCITKQRDIQILNSETLDLESTFFTRSYFLFFPKTKENQYLIYKPKYIFCELSEGKFIFCRYLDNSLKYFIFSKTNPKDNLNLGTDIVVDNFVTCVARVSNDQFLSGHQNGKVCHWYINTNEIVEISLIKAIYANEGAITSLLYNENINAVISSDINNVTFRNLYSFEYLSNIRVSNEMNKKLTIIEVKISSSDFVYVLYHLNYTEEFVLCGYTVNGIYFGKIEGAISNFIFTKRGYLICSFFDNYDLKVYDPVSFEILYTKKNVFDPVKTNMNLFDYDIEKQQFIIGYSKEGKWYLKKINIKKEEKEFLI